MLLAPLVLWRGLSDSIPIGKRGREHVWTLKQNSDGLVFCERYQARVVWRGLLIPTGIKDFEDQVLACVCLIAKHLSVVERLPPYIKELAQAGYSWPGEFHMDQVVLFVDMHSVEAGSLSMSSQRRYSWLPRGDDANPGGNGERRVVRVEAQVDAEVCARPDCWLAGQTIDRLTAGRRARGEQ